MDVSTARRIFKAPNAAFGSIVRGTLTHRGFEARRSCAQNRALDRDDNSLQPTRDGFGWGSGDGWSSAVGETCQLHEQVLRSSPRVHAQGCVLFMVDGRTASLSLVGSAVNCVFSSDFSRNCTRPGAGAAAREARDHANVISGADAKPPMLEIAAQYECSAERRDRNDRQASATRPCKPCPARIRSIAATLVA
jgi:hypothetical protein